MGITPCQIKRLINATCCYCCACEIVGMILNWNWEYKRNLMHHKNGFECMVDKMLLFHGKSRFKATNKLTRLKLSGNFSVTFDDNGAQPDSIIWDILILLFVQIVEIILNVLPVLNTIFIYKKTLVLLSVILSSKL